MNECIRYPFILLISSLVGSAFVLPANASSPQAIHYYQPALSPAPATGNRVDFTPRYRFRPVAGYGENHLHRPPAARHFGGYYGAVMPQPYANSPRFRPVQYYRSHFADQNPWKTAAFAFPQAGYFRPNYYRYPAGSFQGEWRAPPTPAISSAFIQRGFYQPGTPAEFGRFRSGEQWSYSGRFRPFPANRYAPPELFAYNWGRRMPVYQMPVRQLPIAQFYSPRPHQTPESLAYSAPVNAAESRKMATKWRYPHTQSMRYAPVNYQFANTRNPIYFPDRKNIRSVVNPAFPNYAASFSPPHPGYLMRAYRQYRFRPDNRIAAQDGAGETVGGRQLQDGFLDYRERSPAASSHRFRPDNRFSSTFPTVRRGMQPEIAVSSDPESKRYLTNDSRRLSANEFRSFLLEFKDTVDTADTSERSVLDPVRSMNSYKFRSIADNTAG